MFAPASAMISRRKTMDQFELIMLQRKLDKLDKLDDIDELVEAMVDLGASMGDLEEKLDDCIELLEAAAVRPRKRARLKAV
jgi:hypothetical protein